MLRFRHWRLKRGFTLKELQTRTGIPLSMLSLYERGEVDPPTCRIMLIADALEVSIGQLFPRKRPPFTIETPDEILPAPVGVEGD